MKKLRLGFAMMMACAHVFIVFEILIVAYTLPEYALILIDCVVSKSLNKKRNIFLLEILLFSFVRKNRTSVNIK